VITNLEAVLTVPIQAVSSRKGQQVVFLASAPQQPVKVSVGMYNTKFIEIDSGLEEGDQVLLAPPLDADEKDLGGEVLSEGEDVLHGASNHVAKAARKRGGNGRDAGGGSSKQSGPAGFSPSGVGKGAAPGGGSGGPRGNPGGVVRTNPPDIFKQFDKNGDGHLDESERATMRDRFSGITNRPGEPAVK